MEVEQCESYFRFMLQSRLFVEKDYRELRDVHSVQSSASIPHSESPTAGGGLLLSFFCINSFLKQLSFRGRGCLESFETFLCYSSRLP